MEALLIPANLITCNEQTTSEDRISQFVELLENGRRLPPITVRRLNNGFRIVDGRHRLAAHKQLNQPYILAVISL